MKESDVLIIAEAGVNHNGDIYLAKKLIDVAVESGVNIVKFQTFKAEDLVSKSAKQAEYQRLNVDSDNGSQFEMLKKLELSNEHHEELIVYCEQKGVEFFSTAFDVKGLNYLNSLDFKRFKVPSGEITNYPYLKKLAKFGKPVILSTGMSSLEDIRRALIVLESGLKRSDITVLHCNSEYPTPFRDVNLRAMQTIKEEFGVNVGYSDHTLGIEVPIAAVALGARIIEKHFTLDRSLPGPDHKASLEPKELQAMVRAIRNIESALSGSGKKEPSQSERKNLIPGRKSLWYKNSLMRDHILKEEDFVCLRPGDGISPMELVNLVGKKLRRDVQQLEKVKFEDLWLVN